MTTLFRSSVGRMHRTAFTLVEILVAITILSVLMLSIFEVYSNILSLNKRLELGRILQENSRNATEIIAKDVRDRGIDIGYYAPSTESNAYSGSGNTVLSIRANGTAPKNQYYLMHDTSVGPVSCMPEAGDRDCYLGRRVSDTEMVRLTDSRVRISNLRFFISGASSDTFLSGGGGPNVTEGKVTMVFSMEIADRMGVSRALSDAAKLSIQTTISEKLYKSY